MKIFASFCLFSFLAGIFATVYFFFSGSEYLIKSVIFTILVLPFFFFFVLLFSADTCFITMNILIFPLLTFVTWKFNILITSAIALFIVLLIFSICKLRLQQIKKTGEIPQIYFSNAREVYVLNGFLPIYFLGYIAYLGYQNGVLGRTNDIINALGDTEFFWITVRLAIWLALIFVLAIGFFLSMVLLREVLERVSLNGKISALDT